MGQVNNESHRPSPRSQRSGRGPEDRRRRAGATAAGSVPSPVARSAERHGAQGARRQPRHVRGTEGFVKGAEGSDPRLRGHRRSTSSARPGSSSGVGVRGKVVGQWTVWGPHVKRFAPGLLANHGVTVAIAVAVAVILAIGTTFRAVPAYIGAVWMLTNAAPLTISGSELGIAPLLPAVLVLYVHSRRIRSACGVSVTVRGVRTLAALGIGIPSVLTVIAWLMLWDASHVFEVSPPNLFRALVTTVVINGLAVVMGLGSKIWRALLLRRGLSTWPVESVQLAGRFLSVMLVIGAAAVGLELLLNYEAVGRAFDIAGGVGGVLGLSLLSILYFPNAAVGGAAVLMGGEMHIGEGSASLFAVTNTTLPPLPLFAVMPNAPIGVGPILLVIPAIASVVTVFRWFAGRRFIESPLFTASGAGLCAGIAGLVLAWMAGGPLGYYGSTGPLLWLTPLLFLGWLVFPSAVVFGWVAWSGRRVTETAVEVVDAVDTEVSETLGEGSASDGDMGGAIDDAVDDAGDDGVDDAGDDTTDDATDAATNESDTEGSSPSNESDVPTEDPTP